MMLTPALSAGVLVSAVLTIWSDARGRLRLYRLAKPLTTALIIAVAVIAETPVPAAYKALVLAGLLFSLCGDVALMFSEKWFRAGLVAFLAPTLGPLKLPVLVYIAAITAMAGFAAGRFVAWGGTKPLLAFAGAVLFLVSDSVLAYDRFANRIARAQVIILGTYFPAQLLIALSI